MKILLVDDEPLALESLAGLIDWAQHGHTLVGTAANGAEAFQAMGALQPDIVITDIRMPVMDGLELSRMLREHHPEARVVLLTAYRDFEYAQQAMRHGVTDYVLKNQLDEESLVGLLARLAAEIQEHRQAQSAIRHSYYQSLLLNISPIGMVQPAHSGARLVRVLVQLRQPFILGHLGLTQPQEIFLDKTAIEGLLPQNSPLALQQLIGLDRANWGLLLTMEGTSSSEGGLGANGPLGTLVLALQNHMQTHFDAVVDVFFDVGGFSPEKIRASFNGMLEASRFGLFIEKTQVVPYPDITRRFADTDDRHDIVKSELPQISAAAAQADRQALDATLDTVRQYFSVPKWNLGRFRYAFTRLYDLLDTLRADNGLAPLRQAALARRQELAAIFTAQQAWQWLCAEFYQVMAGAGTPVGTVHDKKITAAIEYINKNYGQKLTAKHVAEQVALSEIYFSSLFKKETGVTFLDYLTTHRINIAKYLIRTGGHKVYEVAEKTGYTSPQYFSQVFQKATGYTPQEYRNLGDDDETKL